jgi:hypothetical protein
VAPPKKTSVLMVVRPKAKPRPQGMSEIELALAKPVGVSKKFCLLDVLGTSQSPHDEGRAATNVIEHATRVAAFDNLGDDSSLDIRGAPSPKKTEEMPPPPPPSIPG